MNVCITVGHIQWDAESLGEEAGWKKLIGGGEERRTYVILATIEQFFKKISDSLDIKHSL